MQAIKQQRASALDKWYILGTTKSTSSSMAFDRLRLSNNSNIEVAILSPSDSNNFSGQLYTDSIGTYIYNVDNNIQQIQPFHSGGGWTGAADEHDFSFDCSSFSYGGGNDDSAPILLKGITLSSKFWQMYAYPTGYGGTRNKNAQLDTIDFRTMRIGTVGGQIGRLRLTNQGSVLHYEISVSGEVEPINAKEVRLEGTSSYNVRNALRGLVLGGETGGTLSYDPIDRFMGSSTINQTQSDYDTLISRSWSISGGRPEEI